MKYKRNCPNCNELQIFTTYVGLWHARTKNSVCRSCAKSKKNHPMWGMPHSKEHRKKTSLTLKNHLVSNETKKRMSINHADVVGKHNPMYGRHHSEETKKKIRESITGKIIPGFNPVACQIIDEYGKKYGYNFQHALNGGEFKVVGYSVDGYDKKNNIVIEYYENRHRRNWRKDLVRQRRIMKHLNCKFIILKEWEIQNET